MSRSTLRRPLPKRLPPVAPVLLSSELQQQVQVLAKEWGYLEADSIQAGYERTVARLLREGLDAVESYRPQAAVEQEDDGKVDLNPGGAGTGRANFHKTVTKSMGQVAKRSKAAR